MQNFTHDDSRMPGIYIFFEHNKVMDRIKVMTGAENHDDFLSGIRISGRRHDPKATF